MKRLLFFWILTLSLPAFGLTQNKGILKVFFTEKQSSQDLTALKKNMLEIYNIQLDYNHLKFDKNSHLEEIAFTVDFRNGLKCGYGPVVVGRKKQFGFSRDYRKRAKSPCFCGEVRRWR
jgi:hypothetical protein